ncbi:hypothetical protein TUBRATIS_17950 [Tubulinosema ratisbonensis]|uniref:Uncharacterized protein n=1 Tax=Tubulinosema ratisbonensis TaxID=291195 RepID=A0A437AKP4_9MICR|nr:hypothetical protein TUBRATIS_17950 [Tubulinosema ratisbonensis]
MDPSLLSINKKYTILKERIEWLRSYMTYISNITKRSADLYFRSTEIPRDNAWRDDVIHEFVEIADKSRKVSDELSEKIEKNIIENLSEIEVEISKILTLMKKEIKNNLKEEDGLFVELQNKKEAHKNVWLSNDYDPWLTEYELKMTIKKYFDLREEKEQKLIGKKEEYEILFKDYTHKYENIVKYSVEMIKSYFFNMSSFYESDFLSNPNKFTFYDAKGNVNYEEIIHEKKDLSQIFFNDILDSIKNEVSTENFLKNLKIKKFMICKHKSSSFYKLKFLILTEHNFLHFFDLHDLEKKFTRYAQLIKRLNEIPYNKFTSFILSSSDTLTKEEEKELKELTDLVFQNLDDFNLCKEYSVYFVDKKTRINRTKNEISIFEKPKNQILGFFPKIVKIKAFITNDLYELIYYSEENIQRDNEENKEDENQNLENSDLKNVEEKTVSDIKIEEDNPWND